MVKLGLPREQIKDHVIETFYWQLAQFYRYATPSRIAEAVPALEFVVDTYKRCNPDGQKIDIFPTLYLGVALSKNPGQEERAIKVFQEALENLDKATQMPHRGLIWARAYFSRTLRKKGRVKEAKKQEKLIREWILGHPYSMPPSELKELVIEDGQRDYVFSHPEMMTAFGQMQEMKDPDTGSVVVIDRRMGVTLVHQPR